MKKILYILSIFLVIILFINVKNTKIEENSIRFRIIANSNSINDQNLKKIIKRDLEINLFPLIENSKSIYETRELIHKNEQFIKDLMSKYNIDYEINYGINFFPEKELNGYTYKEGNYESLVITLGEAKGNNWWCVMYPPLCLIDDKSNNKEDYEYKFYIQEILQNNR